MLTKNLDQQSCMSEEVEKTRRWVKSTLFLIVSLAALTVVSWGKDEIISKMGDSRVKQEGRISAEK